MKRIIFLFAIVMLVGCHDEKDELAATFERLNEHMRAKDYDYIIQRSTPASQALVQALTTPENIQIDSLIKICAPHRIGELCVLYEKQIGSFMKSQGKPSDFISYLGYRALHWYDPAYTYELIPDKIRLGNLNHVGIYREEDDTRLASWIQFRQDSTTGEYLFDMIASLQYENQHIRKTLPKELLSIRDKEEQLKSLHANSVVQEAKDFTRMRRAASGN